ncbi:Calcium-binding component of the spindle pole body (SPB) half-bridge [Xylographa pallens]|nr:Calcium-binding component of the spindle pole body (SPB) half-bridge [Xylographa pallens]
MASSSTHPSFPTRPYNPTLGKLPDRSGGFAPPSTAQAREAARLERQERERLEREGQQDPMGQLSEEQREEINEAVGTSVCRAPIPHKKARIPLRRGRSGGGALQKGHLKQSGGMKKKKGCADLFVLGTPQFGLFDLDKDKRVDYHELKVAMKALGFDVPKAELVAILREHGVPSSSSSSSSSSAAAAHNNHPSAAPQAHPTRLLLPLPAFQHLLAQRILARDPRDEILRAFDLFDEGAKGKIDLADLRRVARELGEGLGEEELAAMIDEFDLDGDGAIDREEFVGICLQ